MSSPSTQPWRDPEEIKREEEIADNLESYQTVHYLQQLESKFMRASRAARIVEECRQIIDQACKENLRNLPF